MSSTRKPGNLKKLAKSLEDNPELVQMFQSDPKQALDAMIVDVPDTFVYRVVVISLGAAMIIALLGAIFLVWGGKDAPDIAIAIGSASVGALAGLLAPTPSE